jgi:hypothetical protein
VYNVEGFCEDCNEKADVDGDGVASAFEGGAGFA